MFTGIVEEKGIVRYIQLTGESGVLGIKAKKVLEGTKIGDSIAVNGCCLTVVSQTADTLSFDAGSETLSRTNLDALLELAAAGVSELRHIQQEAIGG